MRTMLAALLLVSFGTAAHAKALSPSAAKQAKQILAARVPNYYANEKSTNNDFGIVKLLGGTKLAATKNPNIVKANIQFDGNELWGGDYHYKVAVDVNLKTKLIHPLGQPVQTKVLN